MGYFSLRKLIVHEDCGNKLKVLKPGEYSFSDSRHDDFFTDGVVIQAIVGMNGSGKSSLLDMLFRMSNNLSALMFRGFDRPASEKLYFIEGVVADLYYVIDGNQGLLQCGEESVTLTFGNESFKWFLWAEDCEYRLNGQLQCDETKFQKAALTAGYFFYTIATNYSVQAYISSDFSSEKQLKWSSDNNKWVEVHDASSWIDRVFHKNDGYMSPIVLNPYRYKGTIDMVKEEVLTTNRLCAIMWETRYSPDAAQMIEGYRLHDIVYRFDLYSLIEKFDDELLKTLPEGSFTSKFLYSYSQKYSIAKTLLDAYGLTVDRKTPLVEISLCIYLAYKTLSVAGKYPSYSHFRALGDINFVFKCPVGKYYHDLVQGLVDSIKEDTSHITLKIRQTLKFIEEISKQKKSELFENHFTYRDYVHLLGLPEQVDSTEVRNGLLPPSTIFKAKIYLIKNESFNLLRGKGYDDKEFNQECWKEAINLNELSSGERQIIFMASTLVYHALNLKSIPDVTRIKYKCALMVLDEVEICFHPDYQRTFIMKLLALIRRMKLTEVLRINVLIVTHSPFVLSDIPQGNIMYLEKGHQLIDEELKARNVMNPFCANINDILHQSFFLDKGFVGEFARQKVLSLTDYLKFNQNRDMWSHEKALFFINEVGEPMIRGHLLNLYVENCAANKEEKIAIYMNEIERLRHEEE